MQDKHMIDKETMLKGVDPCSFDYGLLSALYVAAEEGEKKERQAREIENIYAERSIICLIRDTTPHNLP